MDLSLFYRWERGTPLFRKEELIGPQYGEYKATYLGGHSAYPKSKKCKLHIFPTHVEVPELMLKIPYDRVENVQKMTKEKLTATRIILVGILAFAWKKKQEFLVLTYRDEANMVQNPVFDVAKMEVVMPTIYQAKIATIKPAEAAPGPTIKEKEIIREVVMIPCPYCGGLMPQTSTFCPSCGGKRKA